MSQRDRRGFTERRTDTAPGGEWTCEYCGRRFAPASRSREAYELLVTHIRNDCPDVPAAVRDRYRSRCAGGHCGR